MSFAVMPLSDYKAACDKVREKVDLTTVKFEETDFGYLRSEIFTVPKDGKYIFSCEFSNPIDLSNLYYDSPDWKGEKAPGYFESIGSNNAKTMGNLYAGKQYRLFIDGSTSLTPKDIFKASLSIDGETVVDFVPPPTIKSGELADKVDEVYWTAANNFGLKGKGQGELVTLENVHPIEHKVEVGLSSKNLFNEDKANITKTEDYFSSNIHYTQGSFFELAVQPNEAYTVSYSCLTPNEGVWGAQVLLGVCKPPTWVGASVIARTLLHERHYLNFSADTLTFKVPADVYTIYIQATTALQFKSFMIEKGTTATAYAPYVADFSDCKVTACGKNLFDYEDFMRRWDNGEYYTNDATTNGYFVLDVQLKPNTKYYLKANGTRGSGVVLMSAKEAVNSDAGCTIGVSNTWEAEQAVTTEASGKIYIGAAVAEYVTRELFENALVQIEYGTTASPYEPYNETEYTAAADGTVEGVKSISPVMNLTTNKAGAVINAECFLDPQAVITDLTNTVITLGGEI